MLNLKIRLLTFKSPRVCGVSAGDESQVMSFSSPPLPGFFFFFYFLFPICTLSVHTFVYLFPHLSLLANGNDGNDFPHNLFFLFLMRTFFFNVFNGTLNWCNNKGNKCLIALVAVSSAYRIVIISHSQRQQHHQHRRGWSCRRWCCRRLCQQFRYNVIKLC
ncbi:unnamed protein product [Ceratitis capitata]|uniref:(Mediterranean fruit fly) hypothetical protein n=1 Tax=Ceratitis capitata TaxID=7213 RepID=A0A811VFE5_CERCA|nr:unnamed protein product [Ceratitis capitata]